jgi:hypothetical protein
MKTRKKWRTYKRSVPSVYLTDAKLDLPPDMFPFHDLRILLYLVPRVPHSAMKSKKSARKSAR